MAALSRGGRGGWPDRVAVLERRVVTFALLLALGLALWASYGDRLEGGGGPAAAAEQPLPVSRAGGMAPAFSIPLADGSGSLSPAAFRGRPLLVNFWATWCAPCKLEMPEFQRFQQEQADRAVVLGINMQENPEAVRSFLDERGITYRVALDTDGSVAAAYQVSGLPTTVFVDASGVVRDRVVGSLTYDSLVQRVQRLP